MIKGELEPAIGPLESLKTAFSDISLLTVRVPHSNTLALGLDDFSYFGTALACDLHFSRLLSLWQQQIYPLIWALEAVSQREQFQPF